MRVRIYYEVWENGTEYILTKEGSMKPLVCGFVKNEYNEYVIDEIALEKYRKKYAYEIDYKNKN